MIIIASQLPGSDAPLPALHHNDGVFPNEISEPQRDIILEKVNFWILLTNSDLGENRR